MHAPSLASLLVFASALGLTGCTGGSENPNPATFRAQPGMAISMEGFWVISADAGPDGVSKGSFEFSPGNVLRINGADVSREAIEASIGAPTTFYLNYADGQVFELAFGFRSLTKPDGGIPVVAEFGWRGVAVDVDEILVESVIRLRIGSEPWQSKTVHFSLLRD